MVYFCFQDYFNSTRANSKKFENIFLNKGKDIPIVNSDADWIHNNTDEKN